MKTALPRTSFPMKSDVWPSPTHTVSSSMSPCGDGTYRAKSINGFELTSERFFPFPETEMSQDFGMSWGSGMVTVSVGAPTSLNFSLAHFCVSVPDDIPGIRPHHWLPSFLYLSEIAANSST